MEIIWVIDKRVFFFPFFLLFFLGGCAPIGKVTEGLQTAHATGPADPPGEYASPGTKLVLSPTSLTFVPTDNQKSITVTATDTFVHKEIYLCKTPCTSISDWTKIGEFDGTPVLGTHLRGSTGLSKQVSLSRDILNDQHNFIVVFTCRGIGLCNGNKWLLQRFTATFDECAADADCASGKKCDTTTKKCVAEVLPDLVVESITFDLAAIGPYLQIDTVIVNKGNAPVTTPANGYWTVDGFTQSFYINSDNDPDTGKTITTNIAPGQRLSRHFTSGDVTKSHAVTIAVDVFTQTKESDETNNEKTVNYVASGCTRDDQCGYAGEGGLACNTATGQCVRCTQASHCGTVPGVQCINNQCVYPASLRKCTSEDNCVFGLMNEQCKCTHRGDASGLCAPKFLDVGCWCDDICTAHSTQVNPCAGKPNTGVSCGTIRVCINQQCVLPPCYGQGDLTLCTTLSGTNGKCFGGQCK